MAGEASYIEISGTVRSVVFQNRDNGYAVVRLVTDEGLIFAVGCLPEIYPGEQLVMLGSWANHPSYGDQFKIASAERYMPESLSGIFDYLASGAIKGVGEKTARVLVDALGHETLYHLGNPDRLAMIEGLSRKRAADIAAQFRRQMGMRRLIEFLSENGVSPHAAARLYEVYGDEAHDAVAENPYIMTDEYYGVEFFQADAMAIGLGFSGDSPARVGAAVMFELKHNQNNGHVFLPREKLIDATARLIGVDTDTAQHAVDVLIAEGDVIAEAVAGVEACYPADIYEDECYAAKRLLAMVGTPSGRVRSFEKIVARIAAEQGVTYADGQLEAIRTAAENNVMVLTGGPGTGKTTSVRAIIALFGALGIDTVLAAPTGRAAKRLEELTGLEASTVHRLLGARMSEGRKPVFEKCEDDLLQCGAVVLDEASMMDISLTAALLRAMPARARLVLVGDADQLPSVGAGNVFADVIRSGAVPTVRLTEIFRQAEQSGIVTNAHLINKGEMPPLENKSHDFFFLQRRGEASLAETVTGLVAERLPKNMHIPASDIQVLTPTRRGGAGTAALNRAIQAAVNPPHEDKPERIFADSVFRVGDRIMQTRNNYDIIWTQTFTGPDGTAHTVSGTGMFNGDVGMICAIDLEKGLAVIDFDGRITPYPFELFTDIELAYAITVHKAQGSEYRAAVLALPETAPTLRTRGVLYTAISRARELAIVVGERDIFEEMVMNDRRQRRYSGLRARLENRG